MIGGTALKYDADDINTDVIWPGKYTYLRMDPEQMRAHAMEAFDPEFARKAAEHSILVVGKNFGCGSSREQASECLKCAGIAAVVGASFARIFYRNSINLGLPAIECPGAVTTIETGDRVEIDLEAGQVTAGRQVYTFPKFPPFVLEIIRDGGLINHIRRRG